MMKYLSSEAVGALVVLAKRNYPKDNYPSPIYRRYWFEQKNYEVGNKEFFCYICQSNFNGEVVRNKNLVVEHGIMHLKEHGLLAFL